MSKALWKPDAIDKWGFIYRWRRYDGYILEGDLTCLVGAAGGEDSHACCAVSQPATWKLFTSGYPGWHENLNPHYDYRQLGERECRSTGKPPTTWANKIIKASVAGAR